MTASSQAACPSPVDKHSYGHITYFKRNELTYSWTIHTFSDWLAEAEDQVQYSPTFPVEPNAKYQWCLLFDPATIKKVGETESKHIGLHLILKAAPKKVYAEFTISLKHENEVFHTMKAVNSQKRLFKTDDRMHNWGWKQFIARDALVSKVSNGVLVISCTLAATAEMITEADAATIPTSKPRDDLSNDLLSLVEGEKFGDVTLIVGDQRFLAYKGILAARSTVFAAMFNHDMKENVENYVTITDIEPTVFKELLKYIYTDKIDYLSKLAYELFAAADKYCILPLKALCQQSILANLSISNAAKTLQFADVHQATEIKTRVLRFLSTGAARGVAETAEWKALARTRPRLIKEAFQAVTS